MFYLFVMNIFSILIENICICINNDNFLDDGLFFSIFFKLIV